MSEVAGSSEISAGVIEAMRETLAEGMHKIEHCVGQLDDKQVWWRPRDDMNSVANLMLHLSGNLRQWIVSGVGGAQDVRNRPMEFGDRSNRTKTDVLSILQKTVSEADWALAKVTAADLVSKKR